MAHQYEERFLIRNAEVDDAKRIAQLIADGGADAHIRPDLGVDEEYILKMHQEEVSEQGIDKWRRRILDNDPNRHIIVATHGLHHVIGILHSRRLDEKRASLLGCYIDRDWRNGGARGAAQLLADKALLWFGKNTTTDVMIATYNERSQRFFHRNGFTVPGEQISMGVIPTQIWYRPAQNPDNLEQ